MRPHFQTPSVQKPLLHLLDVLFSSCQTLVALHEPLKVKSRVTTAKGLVRRVRDDSPRVVTETKTSVGRINLDTRTCTKWSLSLNWRKTCLQPMEMDALAMVKDDRVEALSYRILTVCFHLDETHKRVNQQS